MAPASIHTSVSSALHHIICPLGVLQVMTATPNCPSNTRLLTGALSHSQNPEWASDPQCRLQVHPENLGGQLLLSLLNYFLSLDIMLLTPLQHFWTLTWHGFSVSDAPFSTMPSSLWTGDLLSCSLPKQRPSGLSSLHLLPSFPFWNCLWYLHLHSLTSCFCLLSKNIKKN